MKSQFKNAFALQIILLFCLNLPLAAQYREY